MTPCIVCAYWTVAQNASALLTPVTAKASWGERLFDPAHSEFRLFAVTHGGTITYSWDSRFGSVIAGRAVAAFDPFPTFT